MCRVGPPPPPKSMAKFILDIIQLISFLAAPIVLIDTAAFTTFEKKWCLCSHVKWMGLDMELKKKPYMILVMVDKTSGIKKSTLRQIGKVFMHKNSSQLSEESFRVSRTSLEPEIQYTNLRYGINFHCFMVKVHKSFVKVYWSWKSISTFISKLSYSFQ